MLKRCLVCGRPKMNYRTLLTGMYIAVTWMFAAALMVLIVQNKIII